MNSTYRSIHTLSHTLWEENPDLRRRIDLQLRNTNQEFGGEREVIDRRGVAPVVGANGLDRDFKRLLLGLAPVDPRSRRILGPALQSLDQLGFVASRENGLVRNDALRLIGQPDAVGVMTGNIDTIVELKVVERFRETARAVDAAQLLFYALCRYPVSEVIKGNIGMIVVYVVDSWAADTRLEMILNPAPLVPLVTELAA